MLDLLCNVCAAWTRVYTALYVTWNGALDTDRGAIAVANETNSKTEKSPGEGDGAMEREITYYYPDAMVIFGYADGYYIEPESSNYFRFSTLSVVVVFVVCLQSCFCCVLEAQKYFSFIFKNANAQNDAKERLRMKMCFVRYQFTVPFFCVELAIKFRVGNLKRWEFELDWKSLFWGTRIAIYFCGVLQ